MDLTTLQNWLWRAASSIRGEVDAARYKDYILPLIFYKRIDDVFDDELARVGKALGVDPATAGGFVEADRSLVRFYLPAEARWSTIRGRTAGLGERITDNLRAIARENPDLVGVVDRRDFNATEGNQRVLDDNALARLVDILSEQRLGLRDVQPDLIGRAYEYLIRKFAERGSSAGEFFTPTPVGFLIAYILDPADGDEIADWAAGSAGPAHQERAAPPGEDGGAAGQARGRPGAGRHPAPGAALRAGTPGRQRGRRQDERLHPRPGRRHPPGQHHARAGLRERGRQPAPLPQAGRQPHVEPELHRRCVRERRLCPVRVGAAAVQHRRLGLVAAHAHVAGAGRAHGRGAGHRRGEPGQRQQGAQRRARHPQAVRGARRRRVRHPAAREPLLYSGFTNELQKRTTGIRNLMFADYQGIVVPLPPLPEQRRIAAVLNAIQDAIAAQVDVIAAARACKRSLMQRLFTYGPGREPVATKETEIGEIPVHWEVTTIAVIYQLAVRHLGSVVIHGLMVCQYCGFPTLTMA